MTSHLVSIAPALRAALQRNQFDTDTLLAALGPQVHAALGRNEPVPVRLAAQTLGELGVLIQLFLLADEVPRDAAAQALAPLTIDDAVAAGLLETGFGTETGYGPEAGGSTTVRAALDLRPVDLGFGTRWVFADLDGALRPQTATKDHVLGVGHASLSLLRATPTTPTTSLLDLGTGSGIQALHATDYAQTVTGTDLNERAIDLAHATAAINEVEIELLTGSWFDPVAGRTFERVVANPPFVVGDPRVRHIYRDSGLDLDGASELVVRSAIDHLAPGGTAVMLAAWVHIADEDWRARIASWLPEHGVDAWVVQRDVADPELYVGTWMRDGGQDPRDPQAAQRATEWLTHLRESDVDGIGFGFVYLRRTNTPTDLLVEDLTHGFDDPLGDEALAYFDRLAWLRDNDVLTARLRLDPHTALERVFLPGEEGWAQEVVRVHRGGGPRWQHEVDDLVAALLAGMTTGSLALEELIELLAFAHGEDVTTLTEAAVPLVHSLVRHGIVLPA
ncbi:MAG: methyltransferase [Rhodococcus sp.]|nr:methyltransferase [Rhodococcus sp. (in: high G+C Gram-positive bacteria)]